MDGISDGLQSCDDALLNMWNGEGPGECVYLWWGGVKWVTSISCALALTRLISSSSGPASEQAFPACASATETKEKKFTRITSSREL